MTTLFKNVGYALGLNNLDNSQSIISHNGCFADSQIINKLPSLIKTFIFPKTFAIILIMFNLYKWAVINNIKVLYVIKSKRNLCTCDIASVKFKKTSQKSLDYLKKKLQHTLRVKWNLMRWTINRFFLSITLI